jgi:hypothetical protein
MNDRLSKAEIRKDAVQDGVTAASQAVGTVSTILTTAVGDIARAIGSFATEMFEIRDAARKASHDHDHVVAEPAEPVEAGPIEDGAGQPKDI